MFLLLVFLPSTTWCRRQPHMKVPGLRVRVLPWGMPGGMHAALLNFTVILSPHPVSDLSGYQFCFIFGRFSLGSRSGGRRLHVIQWTVCLLSNLSLLKVASHIWRLVKPYYYGIERSNSMRYLKTFLVDVVREHHFSMATTGDAADIPAVTSSLPYCLRHVWYNCRSCCCNSVLWFLKMSW